MQFFVLNLASYSSYLRNLSSPSIRLSSILLPRPILSSAVPSSLPLSPYAFKEPVRRTNREVYIANSPSPSPRQERAGKGPHSRNVSTYIYTCVHEHQKHPLLLAASPYPGVNEQRRCARRHTLGERGDHGSFSRSDRERQGRRRRRRRKKIPLPCNDASAATVVRGGSIPIVGPCRKRRRRGGLATGLASAQQPWREEARSNIAAAPAAGNGNEKLKRRFQLFPSNNPAACFLRRLHLRVFIRCCLPVPAVPHLFPRPSPSSLSIRSPPFRPSFRPERLPRLSAEQLPRRFLLLLLLLLSLLSLLRLLLLRLLASPRSCSV